MSHSPNKCAHEVLEVVPLIMRALVNEIRRHRGPDLSVPQLRTLAFLNLHEGACLSEVAEHIGLTLPSMSKMVDGLVARTFVLRHTDTTDRRRVTLALTEGGRGALQAARETTQAFLAGRLAALPEPQLVAIVKAMGVLRPLFDGGRETNDQASR
jgi:DNA-binding MarR family transcriptional regulator